MIILVVFFFAVVGKTGGTALAARGGQVPARPLPAAVAALRQSDRRRRAGDQRAHPRHSGGAQTHHAAIDALRPISDAVSSTAPPAAAAATTTATATATTPTTSTAATAPAGQVLRLLDANATAAFHDTQSGKVKVAHQLSILDPVDSILSAILEPEPISLQLNLILDEFQPQIMSNFSNRFPYNST